MKKGILFDLDGTLWDSSEEVAISWNEALEKCPDVDVIITVQDVQGIMGMTMNKIADVLFEKYAPQKRMELLEYCCKEENEYLRMHGGKLLPDLKETLIALKQEGYHLSIVSNCQKGYIEAFLEYHQMGTYIDDFESYGATMRPKGENIALVVQRNQLEEAIYVGDTQGDYDAAAFAGIPFIHAKTGYGTINTQVPFIKELRELPKKLDEIKEELE
ncbi:MAG: HAD family hydrolase [Lachnospiraceae bacterium]